MRLRVIVRPHMGFDWKARLVSREINGRHEGSPIQIYEFHRPHALPRREVPECTKYQTSFYSSFEAHLFRRTINDFDNPFGS